MPRDGSLGDMGACAAEDGRAERQATQGSDTVLSAAQFMLLHKQKSQLNKNPCLSSLKKITRGLCAAWRAAAGHYMMVKPHAELAPCSQRCP